MEVIFLQTLLFFLLASIPLYFLLSKSQRKPTSTYHGLRAYPIIGNLPQFLKNHHRFLDWTTDLLAASPTRTITIRRLGNVRGVITADPANIEHILKTHFDNYPKGPVFISRLEDFLGRGIFNSDGHLWRVQRKTSSFEFNTRSLRNLVVANVQNEIANRLLPLLEKSGAAGDVLDLQDVLERFAFHNVCKVAFNVDPACLGDESEGAQKLSSSFALAFKDAASISFGRFRYALPRLWMVKRFLGIGSERRIKESIAVVHDFALQIIRSRKKEKSAVSASQADDLLTRFITLEENSDEFLRDIVISFILAGRETTSSALTWFFWLLSLNPEVENKILQEIRAIRAARNSCSDTVFDYEELREMQYLHAAITESMRLYPPVALNATYCVADDVLPDGTVVTRGDFMTYNSYAMGRMEGVWGKDCREYKPERWLNEAGLFQPESPFKFLAFHAGPRMCLGKEMAYIQMKSIAASVLERFGVEMASDGAQPEKILSLTLRMRRGLPVRVRERERLVD